MKTAIIFPAFVGEYTGSELQAISSFRNTFKERLATASVLLEKDLTDFDILSNNYLDDELRSQYISYIYSCTVSDILESRGVKPAFVSGYSMGIYAALYYCKSVGFSEGLSLIRHAWDVINESCQGHHYGMGMIIGLEEPEIQKWCVDAGDVWICNRNNPHTFIISGLFDPVNRILSAAKEEGALRTSLLPVSKPYHTVVLRDASRHFALEVEKMDFIDPVVPYVSSMNQEMITSGEDLKAEIILNIYHRMSWFETMQSIVDKGTEVFFECGAGDGLTRNFRFIAGNFTAYSILKLEQFLNAAEG